MPPSAISRRPCDACNPVAGSLRSCPIGSALMHACAIFSRQRCVMSASGRSVRLRNVIEARDVNRGPALRHRQGRGRRRSGDHPARIDPRIAGSPDRSRTQRDHDRVTADAKALLQPVPVPRGQEHAGGAEALSCAGSQQYPACRLHRARCARALARSGRRLSALQAQSDRVRSGRRASDRARGIGGDGIDRRANPHDAPHLPERTVSERLLSASQLETVVYAGHAWSEFLPGRFTPSKEGVGLDEAKGGEPIARVTSWNGTGAEGASGRGLHPRQLAAGPAPQHLGLEERRSLEDARRDWTALGWASRPTSSPFPTGRSTSQS